MPARALAVAVLLLAFAPATMGVPEATVGVPQATMGVPEAPPVLARLPAVASYVERILGPSEHATSVSEGSLADEVAAWDARLGMHRAQVDLDRLGTLDPVLAEPVARLLHALRVAAELRDAAFQRVPLDQLAPYLLGSEDRAGLSLVAQVDRAKMAEAADVVARAVDAALPALAAYGAPSQGKPTDAASAPLVNLPPVLVMDPLGVATAYHQDAVLAVDLGGDDVWDNNAGGGLIAVGPVGDPSTFQYFVGGVAVGGEFEDAGVMVSAALALDLAGDDQYGTYKPVWSGSLDAQCTQGPEVRRIVIQGAGSGGLGMLVDVAGNDHYDAKTLAQGHGHIAGIGVLVDMAGDDQYTVIRSGPGSGILGGVGIFADVQGQDTYTFRAPAGGVFNVDASRCDATQRLGLGAAVQESGALFIEGGGDDVYRVESQAFGFASDALSTGSFLDLGGSDDYGGYPGVGDGQQRLSGLANFVDA